MTLTRWKLLAGLLGISIAGVVASADPQCSGNNPLQSRRAPTPPVQTANYAPTVSIVPLVVPVTANPPFQVAVAPPITLTLPMLDAVPTPSIVAVPMLNLEPPQLTVSEAPKPKLVVVQPFVTIPDAVTTPTLSPPKFAPVADNVFDLPLPMTVVKPIAAATLIPELPTKPIPSAPLPATPTLDVPVVREAPAIVASRKPLAKPEEAPTEVSSVRVVVRLGMAQPKFEVLSGEDVLLKAACEKIDVRSIEKGDGVTPLKATGGVRFSAPGCEGTCDQLTVLPGTGEVELAGNVKVRCKRGKGETEIVATTMKFKLGSAPAYAVPEPTTAYKVDLPR